ncbi:unnamed protein product [Somion occarium]|uniref:Adenosine deaminase domain-containing protein n=1 Tax=Somion occarium TaxID=3059160 RepID=A0ABP1DBM8_9APHY
MPKGALLHAHLDATVNARTLLKLALGHPNLHVRTSRNLSFTNLTSTIPEFRPFVTSPSSSFGLTDENYAPGEWVSIHRARESFHERLGGPAGFDKWFIDSLMINPSEAYEKYNTTSKIWRKFRSTFEVSSVRLHLSPVHIQLYNLEVAQELIRYAPIFRGYLHEFLKSSVEDGISYIEARINFHYKFMFGQDGLENIPHREWLVALKQVVEEFRRSLKEQSREDEFIGIKIIYTTLRHAPPEELEWYIEDCIQLKQEFPDLIVGFDLVGHEDTLKPLIDYIDPLTRFKERQNELGIDIPFVFHAGETTGDGTKADMNLYDAILLGTKRIGHGFSLYKHPKLMSICRERGIAIEACPISNEILRLTSSMPMHPLPALLNQGVPIALCSDDPAVFGNMGLTFDYFQVLVASETTGLLTLGQIARDSIQYSLLQSAEKERALELWERRWSKFIETIVHGHHNQDALRN